MRTLTKHTDQFVVKRFLYSAVVTLLISNCALLAAQDIRFHERQAPTQTSSIEKLFSKSNADVNTLPSTISPLLSRSPIAEMRGSLAHSLTQSILEAEISARAGKTKYLHESTVLDAYGVWCQLLKIQCVIDVKSLSAIHAYRLHLAHFIPSMALRDRNGVVSSYITPTESVFLFNDLVRSNGVPVVKIIGAVGSPDLTASQRTTQSPTLQQSLTSMSSYYATTTPQQRSANVAAALEKLSIKVKIPAIKLN